MLFTNWEITILALAPLIFIIFISILYWYKIEYLNISIEQPNRNLKETINNSLLVGTATTKVLNIQLNEYNRVASASRAVKSAAENMLVMRASLDSAIRILILISEASIIALGSFWLFNADDDFTRKLSNSFSHYNFF